MITVQNSSEKWLLSAAESQNDEVEIDLVGLLLRLIEKWKLIAAVAVALAVLGFAYGGLKGVQDARRAVQEPSYSAVAKLYVVNTIPYTVSPEVSDLQLSAYLLADCREIVLNRNVREEVERRLKEMGYDPADSLDEKSRKKAEESLEDGEELKFEATILVSTPSNSRLIYITASGINDPALAMDMANTYAEVAREFIPKRVVGMEATLFEYAEEPEEVELDYSGVKSGAIRSAVLFFMLGAFVVCVPLVLRFIFDDKIRAGEEIEKYLGMPVVGVVPMLSEQNGDGKKLAKKERSKK